jgi:uncharacterized protein (DUF1778 family)
MQSALHIGDQEATMLDIDMSDLSQDKGARTTQLRHGDRLADLIDRAVAALGVEKSTFLRAAIAKEAQRILEESTRHVMSAEDAGKFEAALDRKPTVTSKAKAAAKAYRARVVHAD